MKTAFVAWRGLFVLALLAICAASVQAASVLFVVGNTTLGAGDARIKTLLESKGHVLTIKSGSAAATADATGKALVVISSTVVSTDVNTKFRTVAVPVVLWESHIMDDMGMTNGASGTDYGTVDNVTQVLINLPAHQLAAGFNGGVAVFDAQSIAAWGKVGANALKIATHTADPNKSHIFAYEGGVGMFGLNAPARRVGLFFDDMSSAVMSGNGELLFHAAVNWAMNISPPAITAQPVSISVNANQTAAFSVTATGGSLSYQWRKNGEPIPGATASSYVTQPTTTNDNGTLYSVVVTNSAGSATSSNAVLTVGNSQPVIASHPKSRAVEESQTTQFTVEAAGTPPLAYQWKRGTSNIPGATAASYTIPPATLEDHGVTYTCVVTNGSGSATSQPATLLVVASPRHSQTQYYEALNSTVPSFKLHWRNDAEDRTVNIEKDGVDRLRLKNDYVHIPGKLNFGPNGYIGFRWTHDPATGVDFLSLGTGDEGTPQFEVFRARRTPSGMDGVDFPMGYYFPSFEEVDGSQTWTVNGGANGRGTTYYRTGTSATSESEEVGTLSSNRVKFTLSHTSTEIAHEYEMESSTSLDVGELRFELQQTFPGGGDPIEAVTTVSAYGVNAPRMETEELVANRFVTTPKWRVASSLPDYVFKPGYELKPIEEVEAFARRNHHLPHFPSAEEMSEKGMDVAEMNLKLLRTVEELTLHLATMKKDMEGQKAEVKRLKQALEAKRDGKAGAK